MNANSDSLSICHDPLEMRRLVMEAIDRGQRVGLVPTMGALHEGHLSLVEAAQSTCDCVVTTIFVNPAQFAPHEDLDQYPRTLAEDVKRLSSNSVRYVFAPDVGAIYPLGCSTTISPPDVAARWEGECRPEFFRGVATVVLKLFHIVPAHVAFFGQKDFQQVRVVESMVSDLNVPIEIVACPIVRDPDGLAMSSRNIYLSDDERIQAGSISAGLQAARRAFDGGERGADALRALVIRSMQQAQIEKFDYVAIADPKTLEPLTGSINEAVILVAAHVGTTRLIDNCVLR